MTESTTDPVPFDPVGRIDPPWIADEMPMLQAWLDYHRATLLAKCAGLTDEQLATASVPPSPLTLLGLVRHMCDVERSWFRRGMAGEDLPPIYYSDADPDGDLLGVVPAQADNAFATYQEEVAAARAVAASFATLDAIASRQRHGNDVSLRWIMCHMIEEYARHNGHADLIREAIDGATGE
jgi:hypothetical protein